MARPTLTRGLSLGWILKTRGPIGFMQWAIRSVPYHLWLHLTPQGRRDLRFDESHHVITEGISQPEVEHAVQYAPVQPARFRAAMRRLPIDPHKFTFIDIGSGKGRALILAREFGFRRVLGIEVSEKLCEIARSNAPEAEVRCVNALDFEPPPEDSVIHMFNPFRDPVMSMFAARIEESLETPPPHKVWVVYHRPFFAAAFEQSRVFEEFRREGDRLAIFRAKTEMSAAPK